MGQIVQKKKKGRPSKADLAARAAAEVESNDLHHRRRKTAELDQRDVRRSVRRRSCVRYNLIDYDEDYLEDDEDFELDDEVDDARAAPEEDDDERTEKKLKFVLKLPNSNHSARATGQSVGRPRRPGRRSVSEGKEEEEEEEDEDGEEEDNRIVKKRKISGGEEEEDEEEVEDDYGYNDELEERGRKGESNRGASVFETANDVPSLAPMPEKKQLELILDKLQKKDTYGVFAEPVDPEELPDYHDIIEHPMDFATVRKKLADGSYSNLEEFESDVYLICSNAMQYNAPETIYRKQAWAIKELAQKKFQRVRVDIARTRIEIERADKEAKPEQIIKLTPTIKKQMKKPLNRSVQEPVSSDFASGATLATPDAHNVSCSVQASNCERTGNSEGVMEGISSLADSNFEKVEELQSGKGVLPKYGRKLVVDENRRGTYDNSNHPVDMSESIFLTFEGEDKQLTPVGLYGEHAYAQSLARFAATLGPVAWRIASKRIEQALPPGSKFGRGWVGEYEPLPSPVLVIASRYQEEYPLARKLQSRSFPLKIDEPSKNLVTTIGQASNRPTSNGKQPFMPCSEGSRPANPSGAVQLQNPFVRKLQNAAVPVKDDKVPNISAPANDHGENRPASDAKPNPLPVFRGSRPATPNGIEQQNPFVRRLQNTVPTKSDESPKSPVTSGGRLDIGISSDGKSSFSPNSTGIRPATPCGAASVQPNPNPFSRNNLRPEKMVMNRVELNAPTLTNQNTNHVVQKQFPGAEIPTSWQGDMIARNKNFLHSLPSRPPLPANAGAIPGVFPNGNRVNGFLDINQTASSPSSGVSNQITGTSSTFPPGREQGLSDPVQVMRVLAENAQKQQKPNNSFGPFPVRPSIQSPRVGNTSGAAIAAASAWMSVGAGVKPPVENLSAQRNQISGDRSYNTTQDPYPQMLHPRGEPSVSGTMHFQPARCPVPLHSLVSNPVKTSNEAQAQNMSVVFPNFMATDHSRGQMPSAWQGLSPRTQQTQKQKQDTLPPDLNVAFPVDPQQPDLALQL